MTAMPKAKLEDVKKAFAYFDANGDGKITKDELEAVMKEAGCKFEPDQVQQFIDKIDNDGNGSIELEEFCAIMTTIIAEAMSTEQHLKTIFQAMDKNGDGKISQNELKSAMVNFGVEDINDEDVADILQLIDTDDDGEINYDEFVTMMYMLGIMEEQQLGQS